MASPELPPIDTHAHIATDVTAAQVRHLDGAVIFAVTRSLSEAAAVPHGCHANLIWGIGVHPGDRESLGRYRGERFEALLPRFALVGEVGLDRRAGHLDRQREVFTDILARTAEIPVMMSIHSTGAATEVVDLLQEHRVRGPILHWFGGGADEIRKAADNGAWFSVNGAMKDETIAAMPADRVVTETDFPYTRRAGSRRPGATDPIERQLARIWDCNSMEVRQLLWQNLHALVTASGVRPRLPKSVQSLL